MHKITKTYRDFEGVERTETAYFNMTKTELTEMAIDLPGNMKDAAADVETQGQEAAATKLLETMGEKGVFTFVKELLLKSYGIRHNDGRRFEKSPAISEEFAQTMLFDEIFMDLMSDDKKAAEFVNAIIPADMADKVVPVAAN